MKYLMRKLGAEGFTKALDAEIARVEATRGEALRRETREYIAAYRVPPPRHPGAPAATSGDAAYAIVARHERRRAARSRSLPRSPSTIPIGDYTTAQGRALADAGATTRATERCVSPTSRTCSCRPSAVRRCPAVHARLREIGLAEPGANHITDVVSCPGADYCSLAVTRSMGMAERIRQHLATVQLSAETLGELRVKISGCPNSCGQHHVGDIGLTGMMIKGKDGKERPHYSILIGGGVGEDGGALGKRLGGRFPESVTPRAIVAVAECYRCRTPGRRGFSCLREALRGGSAEPASPWRPPPTKYGSFRRVERDQPPTAADDDRYYQGTILRLNPGSRTGVVRRSRGARSRSPPPISSWSEHRRASPHCGKASASASTSDGRHVGYA